MKINCSKHLKFTLQRNLQLKSIALYESFYVRYSYISVVKLKGHLNFVNPFVKVSVLSRVSLQYLVPLTSSTAHA